MSDDSDLLEGSDEHDDDPTYQPSNSFFQHSIVDPVVRLLRSATTSNSPSSPVNKPEINSSFDTSSETDDDMSSLKNLSSHIPHLTSSNYHQWLSAITSYLRLTDRYVNPETAFAQLEEPNQQKAIAAWDIINMHCDETHMRLIESTNNSTAAFAVLKQRYADSSLISKMGLYVEAFHTPLGFLSKPESMCEYVGRKQTAIVKLASMNEKLTDVAQVTTLLHHLPKTYDTVVTSVMSWTADKLNFVSVSQLLLNEERRLKSLAVADETAAPAASLSKSFRKPLRCKYAPCGKRGHTEDKCHLKREHQENSRKKGFSNKPRAKAYQALSEQDTSSDEAPSDDEEQSNFCFFASPSGGQRPTTSSERTFLIPRARPTFSPKGASRQSVSKRRSKLDIAKFPRNADLRILIDNSLATEGGRPNIGHRNDRNRKPNQSAADAVPEYETAVSFDPDVLELHVNNHEMNFDGYSNKHLNLYAFSCFRSETNNSFRETWIVDSGASTHMCNDKSRFRSLEFCKSGSVRIANGEILPIKGYGTVEMKVTDSSVSHRLVLEHVAFIPELDLNLLSVRKITAVGHEVLFDNNACYLLHNKRKILLGSLKDNCYRLNEQKNTEAYRCVHEWHKLLAHRNLRAIKSQPDLKITKCHCNPNCESCIKGKLPHTPYPKVAFKKENVLDVVVSDICGPIPVESHGKSKYFVTFIDAKSNFTVVKLLRSKSDCKTATIEFIESLKTSLKSKPRIFRSDRGGEYVDAELQSYLKKEGIKIELTCPHSSPQNGIAERMNRTLCDAVRTMIIESKLPPFLWSEAIQNTVYTFNRMVRKGKKVTPFEEFFKEKPSTTFVEFGADVFVGTSHEGRKKLDPRAIKMKMLRVDDQSKGFRVWDGHKIHVERNIKFIDDKRRPAERNSEESPTNSTCEKPAVTPPENLITEIRRSERLRNKTMPDANVLIVARGDEPKTYNQAINCEEKRMWFESMQNELNSIEKNKTWTLVDLPAGRQAIGSRWVYKIKRNADNDPVKYKSRLVAQGFTQKFGVDYDEVFAPVARSQTFRTLLSVASSRKMIIKQFDVTSAFLNGRLDEEIYMKPAPGSQFGDKVYKLHKSIYGLKQAARVWNKALDRKMCEIGFTQSKTDPCLYIYSADGKDCFSIQHVDDLLFAAIDESTIDMLTARIAADFELKNLGKLKHFLGIDVQTTLEGGFQISQRGYIEKIAAELSLLDAKPSKFPLDPGYYKITDENFLNNNTEYRKIIGMLLYAAVNTRPDISASVNILAQRMEKPREVDLLEAKRVVKYLMGTKGIRLNFSGGADESFSFRAYSDANWAESRTDRKSNSGILCLLNGTPLSWSSRKQGVVATSTTEAEFYAIAEAAKEMMWLRQLLIDMKVPVPSSISISSDNQSAIKMLENDKFSHRTKHIDVQYHFLKDMIQKKHIALAFVPTESNIADLLTKPLAGPRIEMLRKLAGFVE